MLIMRFYDPSTTGLSTNVDGRPTAAAVDGSAVPAATAAPAAATAAAAAAADELVPAGAARQYGELHRPGGCDVIPRYARADVS